MDGVHVYIFCSQKVIFKFVIDIFELIDDLDFA
jgi:hypothetical protein